MNPEELPPFAHIRIVDHGHFVKVIDCTGYSEPMSYCGAIRMLRDLGFEKVDTGRKDDRHNELWRLPSDRQTQREDIAEPIRSGGPVPIGVEE